MLFVKMGLTLGTQHESLPSYSTSRVVKSFGKTFFFLLYILFVVICVLNIRGVWGSFKNSEIFDFTFLW